MVSPHQAISLSLTSTPEGEKKEKVDDAKSIIHKFFTIQGDRLHFSRYSEWSALTSQEIKQFIKEQHKIKSVYLAGHMDDLPKEIIDNLMIRNPHSYPLLDK